MDSGPYDLVPYGSGPYDLVLMTLVPMMLHSAIYVAGLSGSFNANTPVEEPRFGLNIFYSSQDMIKGLGRAKKLCLALSTF